MNLRQSLVASAVAACMLTVASAQQTDYSKVEIKSEKLTDHLYVLYGAGGNSGLLIGDDGAVLIDDQFAPLAPKLQAAIKALTDKPVKFTLNTHFHFDHTQANAEFGRAGAIIVAHDNTRTRLQQPQVIKTFNVNEPAMAAAGLPVVTFPEKLSLHLNGEDIDALYLPNAHTDSDVAYYFKTANAVHVGDVFAMSAYPFIDTENGGSLNGVIAALEKLAKWTKPDTKFIRGHAPVGTRADLTEYHDMLVAVRTRILDAIKAGKTQEQVVASKPTKDFDAKFSSAMIKADLFVQRAFVDLRRNK
jgi:cyclase